MVYDTDGSGNVLRGDHPKNAGDRAYGHGDEITLELTGSLSADDPGVADGKLEKGRFVQLDGNGGVSRIVADANDTTGDFIYDGEYDAVLKHGAEIGDEVTVHLRGAQRVAEPQESPGDGTSDSRVDDDVWPVVETYDNLDELIVLR